MQENKDVLIAVRLTVEMVAQIDRVAEQLAKTSPGARWTRSAALRRLVIEGLKAFELPAPVSER
jgi:hypothetical protein